MGRIQDTLIVADISQRANSICRLRATGPFFLSHEPKIRSIPLARPTLGNLAPTARIALAEDVRRRLRGSQARGNNLSLPVALCGVSHAPEVHRRQVSHVHVAVRYLG